MISIKNLKHRKLGYRNFVFELNSACNHRCTYCYNFWKTSPYPEGTSNLDHWEKIVEKLKSETDISLVSLSGGEPLLFPNISDLVRMLRKHGIEVNLITNGSLITEQRAEELIRSGVSVFEVSLPAHNEQLHKLIKNSSDFYKVIDGVANITSRGGKVAIVFVATKQNIEYIKEVVDLSIVLGAKALMFNRINLAAKEQFDLIPTVEQLKKALTYLNNFSLEYEFPIVSSIPIPPCVIDMSEYTSLSFGYCPKEDGVMYTTIDYLGNVRYCNHTPQVLGNLIKESFADIISSQTRTEFKNIMPKKCLECRHVNLCGGSCKAAGLVCFGSAEILDPFVSLSLTGDPNGIRTHDLCPEKAAS